MVHNSSSENSHKVAAFPESGKFSCDQSCTGWKLYSLCSHTVAVAETLRLSKEFQSEVVQEVSKPYNACEH